MVSPVKNLITSLELPGLPGVFLSTRLCLVKVHNFKLVVFWFFFFLLQVVVCFMVESGFGGGL